MTREKFVIAKAGKPIAKVTVIDSPDAGQQKKIGFMKGQFKFPKTLIVWVRMTYLIFSEFETDLLPDTHKQIIRCRIKRPHQLKLIS